jgi:hypothetical protein
MEHWFWFIGLPFVALRIAFGLGFDYDSLMVLAMEDRCSHSLTASHLCRLGFYVGQGGLQRCCQIDGAHVVLICCWEKVET